MTTYLTSNTYEGNYSVQTKEGTPLGVARWQWVGIYAGRLVRRLVGVRRPEADEPFQGME